MKSKSLFVSVSMLLVCVGCGGGGGGGSEQAGRQPPASQTPAPAAIDPATAATVSGTISFEGAPPAEAKINMSADPVCQSLHSEPVMTQTSVVNNGKLQWVFVYVKTGLEGRTFPKPSTPIVIEQKGCRYEPHVLGVMAGQPVDIVNSDETLHNIHAMPAKNSQFNIGQPLKGMKNTKTFDAEEVMIPVKCDVHSWMSSYIGVLSHPFYAVSDANGAFSITGLPPGTYTLEAWHEKFGTQTMQVTLGPSETRTADFTFKATS